jgi:hypothetical protein
VGSGMRLYSMPFDQERIMWQISFQINESDGKILANSPSMLKSEILNRCKEYVMNII